MINTRKLGSMHGTCTECTVRDHCIVKNLPESDLNHLHCGSKRFAKGSHLLRQGEEVSYLYSIKSGCAKSYTNTISAEEPTRQFYYSGDMIGLEALVWQKSPVNVLAIQDCTVCTFPLPALKAICRSTPQAQDYIIEQFAQAATRSYDLSIVASAEKRLAAFFINFSERQAEQGFSRGSFVLPMSRMEIANYLRLAHETISRVLSIMRRKQIVDVSARSVRILSIDDLAEVADGARL